MMLRHVDLCSGIGGFSLGFEWAELSTPILFCDTEEWCRKILAKNFPNVPIATDVKELAHDPERLVPDCDILTAGYPCQPFSVAGKQKGTEDDRHIWPYILRIVAHKRPTWCVFENVHGHIALGLDQVLLDLEAEGYATRTFIVPACGVNAPHRRDRLWIVGNAQHDGSSTAKVGGVNEEDARGASQGQIQTEQPSRTSGREDDGSLRQELADSNGIGRGGGNSAGRGVGERNVQSEEQGRSSVGRETERRSESYREDVADTQSEQSTPDDNGGEQGAVSEPQQVQPRGSDSWGGRGCNWEIEPDVGRVAHGIPRRVDRLKGLGNAIVPQIAMNIGLAIKEEDNENKI
jgi:DNA (cytosine-5)-methyltransferase 1